MKIGDLAKRMQTTKIGLIVDITRDSRLFDSEWQVLIYFMFEQFPQIISFNIQDVEVMNGR
jgi:hypothetical protein